MKKIINSTLLVLIIFSSCTLEKMIEKKGPDAAIEIIDKDRAKNWPPIIDHTGSEYIDGTIGGIIQDGFKDHNNSCNLCDLIPGRDYIPKNVKLKIKDFKDDTVETALISRSLI